MKIQGVIAQSRVEARNSMAIVDKGVDEPIYVAQAINNGRAGFDRASIRRQIEFGRMNRSSAGSQACHLPSYKLKAEFKSSAMLE